LIQVHSQKNMQDILVIKSVLSRYINTASQLIVKLDCRWINVDDDET